MRATFNRSLTVWGILGKKSYVGGDVVDLEQEDFDFLIGQFPGHLSACGGDVLLPFEDEVPLPFEEEVPPPPPVEESVVESPQPPIPSRKGKGFRI